MKKIILTMGILSFIANLSFAADQKLDRKQIYELRKECGKSAVEFAQRGKLCDGTGNYENHYNVKLNICFILVSASCRADTSNDRDRFWAEALFDVNENKQYASYIGEGKIVGDNAALCYVGNNQCKNLTEFRQLIKPYPKE